MKISLAGIFMIGAAAITLGAAIGTTIWPQYATPISQIAAAVGTFWGVVGTALTTPGAQTQSVASRIEEPDVKRTLVEAVANLQGVEPVRINASGDQTLKDMSTDPMVNKVVPAKLGG